MQKCVDCWSETGILFSCADTKFSQTARGKLKDAVFAIPETEEYLPALGISNNSSSLIRLLTRNPILYPALFTLSVKLTVIKNLSAVGRKELYCHTSNRSWQEEN